MAHADPVGPTDLRIELLEHEADGEPRHGALARALHLHADRPPGRERRSCLVSASPGGLIAEHHDEFDFYRWARQALGPPGVLLGWTPLVRSAVRRGARGRLDEFIGRS